MKDAPYDYPHYATPDQDCDGECPIHEDVVVLPESEARGCLLIVFVMGAAMSAIAFGLYFIHQALN